MSVFDSIAEIAGTGYDCDPERFEIGEMADYPRFEYGMRQVLRAGDALRTDIAWTAESTQEVLEVFKIANNWRDSHALPMRLVRREMLGQMKRNNLVGLTVARLKRMPSIRKKLREQPWNLNQIQDIAGCRAILPTMSDVRVLAHALKEGSKHIFRREDDYIGKPKLGGYRSHHLVFNFCGTGKYEPFNNRRIEIQLRTRLQHSWATAVEAVGLLRSEDMKGGRGDSDWLRLFELMAAEIALAEKCPEPVGMPPRKERIEEIGELDKKLQAASTLVNFSAAAELSDHLYTSDYRPAYYMIEFDKEKKTVSVRGFEKATNGTRAYDNAEIDAAQSGVGKSNIVFVEANQVETLKKAYPNYFGDTHVFTQNLKKIVLGKEAIEYAVPPRPKAPRMRQEKEKPDLSWFREHRRRRWVYS